MVAAGGIGDGRGIAAALMLGAEGVWIGTRFLATAECGVSDAYKSRVLAATGTMSIELSKVDAGTKLDVTYAAVGYFPKGMNLFAAPSDNVLTEQFTRLKNYIERGSPAPK